MKKIFLVSIFLSTMFIYGNSLTASHFLSFIIPCYNCANTVEESIASIYKQNMTIPFEVICTDDGSEDGTAEVLVECEKKYPGLRVVTHKVNKGGAAARNTCVKCSNGDLIFCLDSDNVLSDNLIMRLVLRLDESGCDAAAVGELRYFTGNFRHSHSWVYKAPNDIVTIEHIMSTHITPACSGNYLYTRKSFDRAGGYKAEDRSAMDTWIFGLRQLAKGSRIAILPNSFYWHRLLSNSYWHREGRNNSRAAYEALKDFPEIFTEATNEFLRTVDVQTRDFFTDFNAGIFKLRSHDEF
jgi:glycosyltransferase involved in cell wall biosynthesis